MWTENNAIFLKVFEPTVKSLLANVEILLSGKYDEAEEIQIRYVFGKFITAFGNSIFHQFHIVCNASTLSR